MRIDFDTRKEATEYVNKMRERMTDDEKCRSESMLRLYNELLEMYRAAPAENWKCDIELIRCVLWADKQWIIVKYRRSRIDDIFAFIPKRLFTQVN